MGSRSDYVYTSELIREVRDHIALEVLPIQQRSYYVFDQDDLEAHFKYDTFPFIAVMYSGMDPSEDASGTNPVKDFSSLSAVMQDLSISIVIVDQYPGAGMDTDNDDFVKNSLTDLLDDTRHAMLGYRGVNWRPWRWIGESPLESSIRNVVMYAQNWRTKVILKK